MARIDPHRRTLDCKLVYYGPGLSGKTTNLEHVYASVPKKRRGELSTIATRGDRTIFFDMLPLDLGSIEGLRVRVGLFTVPGQSYYAATRALVLSGADGVVFVADSQAQRLPENVAAVEELNTNLLEGGRPLLSTPHVFQWNKRDMPDALPTDNLSRLLNQHGAQAFEAVALRGEGVLETLSAATRLMLVSVREQLAGGELQVKRSDERPPTTPLVRRGPAPRQILTSSDDLAAATEGSLGEQIGGCTLVEKLGEGGMGVVYLGRRDATGETVVVKTIKPGKTSPKRVRRFFREARAAALLEHENIVAVREVGTDAASGMHYMIMQHVGGVNLRDHVELRGPLEPFEALRLVHEVARGLAVAHEAGVIHRDVKPENLILTPAGEVRLIDFGLAKDRDQLAVSHSGERVGTPAYMAPEMRDAGGGDARADVFSLGLTYYHLIRGEIPYTGCRVRDVWNNEARISPPALPAPILALLERMLARDPAARPRDAGALLEELEALWDPSLDMSKRGTPTRGFWLWREPKLRAARDPIAGFGPVPAAPDAATASVIVAEPVPAAELMETPQPDGPAGHGAYLSEVLTALNTWDALDVDFDARSSQELARLIDEAWGSNPPTWGQSARREPRPVGGPDHPERLLGRDWRDDLRQAIDGIDAQEVSERRRRRLSRDPGQAELNALLRAGPASPPSQRLRKVSPSDQRPDLTDAIKRNRRHPQPYTRRGIARAKAGKLEGAIRDYTRALRLDPDYLPALANRACANFHLERYAEVEEDATRALELAPRLAKAWLFRGLARALAGRGRQALGDLTRFLELSPYSPYVHYVRRLLEHGPGGPR